jgi:hypothetical protein
VFPRWRGETRLGEWCSEEVGEVDRGGDIGRIGEIGDRFLMALASIISDPSEARVRVVRAASEGGIQGSEVSDKRGATKSQGMKCRKEGKVELTISWITIIRMEMILMDRS